MFAHGFQRFHSTFTNTILDLIAFPNLVRLGDWGSSTRFIECDSPELKKNLVYFIPHFVFSGWHSVWNMERTLKICYMSM